MVKRESNFELLRVISMMFIIFHHLMLFGGYQFSNSFIFNDFVYAFFVCGGKMGALLFAMITGYYMVEKKDIKMSKLISMEMQVLFYSLIILGIFFIIDKDSLNFMNILKGIFPNIFRTYWFYSGYFMLYLCSPYLNKILLNSLHKEVRNLCIIGLIFLILIPSFIMFKDFDISEWLYLFYYYILGSYIKLYGDNIKIKSYIWVMLYLFVYLFMVGLVIYINYSLSISWIDLGVTYVDSVLVFICCISLFMLFKNIKLGYSKVINMLGSCAFGVYLFHDNYLVRDLLWKNIFISDRLCSGLGLFINSILVMILVYMIGILIEYVRKSIFKYFNVVKNKLTFSL